MFPRLLCLSLLSGLLALCGCASGTTGSSTTTTPPPAGSYLSLNGNWSVQPSSLPPGRTNTPISYISGSLQSNEGSVTGILRAYDSLNVTPCVSPTQDLPATGTLDTSGNLSLTFPIAGGTGTITSALPSSLPGYSAMSYQIDGGACAQGANAGDIVEYAPVTGTYTGYTTSSQGMVNVSASLTQSSTPDADGLFSLSGTITLSGTRCNASFSFSGGAVSGAGIDNYQEATYQSPNGDFYATTVLDASEIQVQRIDAYSSSWCESLVGGTLERQ